VNGAVFILFTIGFKSSKQGTLQPLAQGHYTPVSPISCHPQMEHRHWPIPSSTPPRADTCQRIARAIRSRFLVTNGDSKRKEISNTSSVLC
jgi:hypothetical protein